LKKKGKQAEEKAMAGFVPSSYYPFSTILPNVGEEKKRKKRGEG